MPASAADDRKRLSVERDVTASQLEDARVAAECRVAQALSTTTIARRARRICR